MEGKNQLHQRLARMREKKKGPMFQPRQHSSFMYYTPVPVHHHHHFCAIRSSKSSTPPTQIHPVATQYTKQHIKHDHTNNSLISPLTR